MYMFLNLNGKQPLGKPHDSKEDEKSPAESWD